MENPVEKQMLAKSFARFQETFANLYNSFFVCLFVSVEVRSLISLFGIYKWTITENAW